MGRKGVLRNYDNNGNLISLECRKCHKVKVVSEFSKHKNKKDAKKALASHNFICITCFLLNVPAPGDSHRHHSSGTVLRG